MRLLTSLLALCSCVTLADPYLPFRADYEVFHGNSSLGGGYYELEQLDDNRYQMGYHSSVKWMLLSDKRSELTEFTVQDGQLVPQRYEMKRSGTGPDFGATIVFDHDKGSIDARYKKRQAEFELTSPIFDSLLYQQQMRLDVAAGEKTELYYPLVQKTDQRDYRFKVTEEETITLPYGELDTIKVERVRGPDSPKETIIWLVPELSYIVARLAHFEDGELKADMRLQKVTFEEPAGESMAANPEDSGSAENEAP
ncbi:DUF3108 domain-containing protein [Ferrimonas marina]|uniref:DUF3108 domain-containing protein n=1 Tax=Ferrimonas marina TaxID=299255 RepID=A0A1M5Z5T2_9GAMM|nr:DUF3108 domain-containing protein [Ferrimonas marina]SHI19514.1 Protein of unknown function [Ferrimonas marina]